MNETLLKTRQQAGEKGALWHAVVNRALQTRGREVDGGGNECVGELLTSWGKLIKGSWLGRITRPQEVTCWRGSIRERVRLVRAAHKYLWLVTDRWDATWNWLALLGGMLIFSVIPTRTLWIVVLNEWRTVSGVGKSLVMNNIFTYNLLRFPLTFFLITD